jgi:hypothetical protein
MTWQVTGKQKFPAVIGEPFGGGFFAGYISHTANGNPTHALIEPNCRLNVFRWCVPRCSILR